MALAGRPPAAPVTPPAAARVRRGALVLLASSCCGWGPGLCAGVAVAESGLLRRSAWPPRVGPADLRDPVEPLPGHFGKPWKGRGEEGPRAPQPLGDAELQEIRSVSCLQARQLDPTYPCSGGDIVPEDVLEGLAKEEAPQRLSLGNFPSFRDAACHGEGQLLCDPDGLLTRSERVVLASELKLFRERTMVSCGHAARALGEQEDLARRHFNLAVVVLRDWPEEESDPASLQQLGRLVLQQWGLIPIYNGVDAGNPVDEASASSADYNANCPSAAALVVLPDFAEAALAAPSCEFICAERGGDEVAASMQVAMRRGASIADATREAVKEVAAALAAGAKSPLSMAVPSSQRAHADERLLRRMEERYLKSDAFLVLLQRTIFVGAFVFMIFAFVSFVYFNCLAPQALSLRKGG